MLGWPVAPLRTALTERRQVALQAGQPRQQLLAGQTAGREMALQHLENRQMNADKMRVIDAPGNIESREQIVQTLVINARHGSELMAVTVLHLNLADLPRLLSA